MLARFHNYTMISAPPPSSGGVVLVSALNILEGYDLAKLGDRSAAWVQIVTEAWRRAYMDRADYLGDPDYNQIPVAALTAKAYAAAWREEHRAGQGNTERDARAARGLCAACADDGGAAPAGVDGHDALFGCGSEGNAVAVTTTLNDSFGSHVTAGSLGFLLNDEMDDFAVEDGRAQYVWADPGACECDCAGQATVEFDDADDRAGETANCATCLVRRAVDGLSRRWGIFFCRRPRAG